jgi:hypothetical protein
MMRFYLPRVAANPYGLLQSFLFANQLAGRHGQTV